MIRRGAAAMLALLAASAAAQDGPRFCPNRPDLGSGACTIEPGRVLLEASAIDWERDDAGGERRDAFLFGDILLRTGLDDRTEIQVGAALVGHIRDRSSGRGDRTTSIGDVRLGVRRNLLNPDGDGLSIAVEPFVVAPIGERPVGDGDWSGGVALPVSYELADRWDLGFTGELAAAADEDGDGRHASALGIVGLGYAVTDQVGVVAELSLGRDEDPAGATTEAVAALSAGWRPRPTLQWDVLAAIGLNRSSPDIRIALGGAVLF